MHVFVCIKYEYVMKYTFVIMPFIIRYRPAVFNRWPPGRIRPTSLLFVAPELLFLHYVFWLGQHVYTGTCLHANDTQTAGSLTAASATFNVHFCFRSSLRIYILSIVRD